MSPVRTVGLVPHPERAAAQELAWRAAARLAAAGVEVRALAGDAPGLTAHHVDREHFAAGLDLVVSLGGDGTMLRAVDLVAMAGVPVLGVNAGQLGYLADVEPAALEDALTRVVAGDYEVSDRMMLEVEVQGPAHSGTFRALNEAVLEKAKPGRIVRLDVSINGTPFTTFAADGVIVATPTGSTAYSFSARGPIVSPRHDCIVLTPVSPHMLFDRPLVLDPREVVGFTVADGSSVELTVDGRGIGTLTAGTTVRCTGADRPARIVTLGPRDFHQVLKAKFGLADR
ncbi:MAG: NAD(+)/NADH kinase [Actinomycetes bacterium]